MPLSINVDLEPDIPDKTFAAQPNTCSSIKHSYKNLPTRTNLAAEENQEIQKALENSANLTNDEINAKIKWIKRKNKEATQITLAFAAQGVSFPPPDVDISIALENSNACNVIAKNFTEIQKNLLDANATMAELTIDETLHDVAIQIRNNGVFFPEQMIPKDHFQPISYSQILAGQSKIASSKMVGEDYGGAGRGLAGIYHALKKHDGDLLIQNNQEGGTAIHVTSPKLPVEILAKPMSPVGNLSTTVILNNLLQNLSFNAQAQVIEEISDCAGEINFRTENLQELAELPIVCVLTSIVNT
jgi:hypothetical protein